MRWGGSPHLKPTSTSTISRLGPTRSDSARQPGGGTSTVYSGCRSPQATASSRHDDSQRFGYHAAHRAPGAAGVGSTPDTALRRRTAAAGIGERFDGSGGIGRKQRERCSRDL